MGKVLKEQKTDSVENCGGYSSLVGTKQFPCFTLWKKARHYVRQKCLSKRAIVPSSILRKGKILFLQYLILIFGRQSSTFDRMSI